MREGGLIHRTTIVRADTRYFVRHRRFVALARVFWHTLVLRHYGERCQQCGRRMPLIWWSPTPLWCELVTNSGGGCLCPRCFDRIADAAGIRLMWTPMVVSRTIGGERVPTTNWWLSDTRDWLMMGELDSACFERDLCISDGIYPTQWPWKRVKDALADVIPPSSNAWGKPEALPEPVTRGATEGNQ